MNRRILLIVTGSVGAFKAAALASKLAQAGFEVRTVLSAGAREFIGPATFEGVTRHRVYSDIFAAGDAMAHIDLVRWAELTVVYPASGNTLTKLAAGRADDLVGTLFLAHDFKLPYWIVPAMNPTMLAHPAIAAATKRLKEWGVRVFDADEGRMACGEVGTGRLVEPEVLLAKIELHFGSPDVVKAVHRRKILITGGGTSEAIDPVRVLTNTSTGETGVRLANSLAEAGHAVTLLIAESSPFRAVVQTSVRTESFRSFDDLDARMREELSRGRYDCLIHAAAVSDYHVERIETAAGAEVSGTVKIHSKDGLVLRLAPNPKILDQVRAYAGDSHLRVISFKLATPSADGAATDLSGYESDLIVHNAVAGIERGSDRHAGEIYERTSAGYRVRSTFRTKTDLAKAIQEAVNS